MKPLCLLALLLGVGNTISLGNTAGLFEYDKEAIASQFGAIDHLEAYLNQHDTIDLKGYFHWGSRAVWA
ncbi:MAG: hypothetical protein HYZ16_00950 [Bacteroidetes bacterium]|jgi:hypothetical protein|nr:hypothetical protein [Bacteroidota bacterium]